MKNALIVDHSNRGIFGWLMNEQFRQRRELFVGDLSWDIPCTELIEMDQYDRAETTYILIEEAGQLVGYARLLPTTARVSYGSNSYSFLVRDAAAGMLPGIPSEIIPLQDVPVSPSVWEMTRVEAKDRRSLELIFSTASEFLTGLGVERTITFTRRSFRTMLDRLGYPTTIAGPEVVYGGKPYCVLSTLLVAEPSHDMAERHLKDRKSCV